VLLTYVALKTAFNLPILGLGLREVIDGMFELYHSADCPYDATWGSHGSQNFASSLSERHVKETSPKLGSLQLASNQRLVSSCGRLPGLSGAPDFFIAPSRPTSCANFLHRRAVSRSGPAELGF
jgi:hypothetical protein